MVIALTRSDSFGATDVKQEKAWREAYAKGNPLPTDQEKLLSFLDLYDKIKRKGMLPYSSAERFVPGGSQGRSMKKLNFIRNEFVHFTPKGWRSRMPELLLLFRPSERNANKSFVTKKSH